MFNKSQITKGFQFTATNGVTYTVTARNLFDTDGLPLNYVEIVFTDGKTIHKADLDEFFVA